jgi:predicted enzyme related to lactoylglutathione lyase
MTSNPVGWFEIYVQDMPRAKEFYTRVFDFEFTDLNMPEIDMWGFPMDFNIHGAGGALVKMEGFPSGGNSVLVYFSCEDCAVEAEKAASSGGKVFREKHSIGEHGFIALVLDTEGNMIGLHSMS